MWIANLRLDRPSGRLHGDGPGRVTSTRYSKNPFGKSDRNDAKDGRARGGDLVFVHVQFERELTGNLFQRQTTIRDQVKAVYGPVSEWTETLAESQVVRGEGTGAVLSCRELTIAEMGRGDDRGLELQATGNASVEGSARLGFFTAQAQSITYAESKDVLILAGDGRSDAVLMRRRDLGQPPSKLEARTIYFRPATYKTTFNGIKSLDLLDFAPGASRDSRAPVRSGPLR